VRENAVRKKRILTVVHNFIMDNCIYHPSLMISLPRDHVLQVVSAAADLIKDLNAEAGDIYEQVASCCNRSRPLCRDWKCTEACISGDPWDDTLVPRLSESSDVHEWLSAHGIEHGHPFYRNFCYRHINKYVRSNGKWVEMPEIPELRRSMVRRVDPTQEQEGSLFYFTDDSQSLLGSFLNELSDPENSVPSEFPSPGLQATP